MNYNVTKPEQYLFGVNDHENYIHNQAEASLKNNVSTYEELRNKVKVNSLETQLVKDATEKIRIMGVTIHEFTITDINYAPKIAKSMLIKQPTQAYNEAKKDIALASVDIVNELVGEYKTMDLKIRDQMIKT